MISSAIFVLVVALYWSSVHSTSHFGEILGVCQICLRLFSWPRENIWPGLFKRNCGEFCSSTVLTATCYRPSTHCICARKFVPVPTPLNQKWSTIH